MLFLLGKCDEIVRDVTACDLEDGKLNVEVSDPLDVTVSHLGLPLLEDLLDWVGLQARKKGDESRVLLLEVGARCGCHVLWLAVIQLWGIDGCILFITLFV